MAPTFNFSVAAIFMMRGSCTYLSCRTDGLWQNAGGKLDPGEVPRDAAQRELFEETGLLIPLERFRRIGTCAVPEGRYEVHGFVVHLDAGEVPMHTEPDKARTGWMLFDLGEARRLRTVPRLTDFLDLMAA